MEVICSPVEMTAWSNKKIAQGKIVSLVPTMGYFHEGHLRLMRYAKTKSDFVVVSLFVNPIQFGPGEDLSRYPVDLDRDRMLADKEMVDALFIPDAKDMYPEGFNTQIQVSGVTETLCGRSRPGHFIGVTTVVAKLFNIVKPNMAVFGRKDFQQLAVIRKMVQDLDWDVSIIGHPIVREEDGLAMSSRNSYLTSSERKTAICLFSSIQYARNKFAQNKHVAPSSLLDEIKSFIQGFNGVNIEYIQLVNQETLENVNALDDNTLLVLAVKIGKTRLIDNGLLYDGV